MTKIIYYSEVLRKKDSKETKDKVEVIEGKKYSLYFLYDGVEDDVNSNRAISAASKFIKKSYTNYQEKNKVNLINLIFDAHKKIIELDLVEAKTGIVALCVPKKEGENPYFVFIGNSGVYSVLYNQFIRINNKKSDNVLGQKKFKKSDIIQLTINREKSPIFICSDGFMNLLAQKRKDILKILNQKDTGSSRASMSRIMKARNFDNLAYLYVRRKNI